MNKGRLGNTRSGLFLFLFAYAAGLLVLLPRLSLWLDEVLTLIGSIQPDLASLLSYIHTTPGSTLLAFLLPRWCIQLLGNSSFAARLPSALFSFAACCGVYVLARRAGLRWPLLAVAIFALLPLQFRYAMEARPYAPALCLTVWSTVVFTKLTERPGSWALAALYTLINALSVHVLAFAIFVPSAHVLYLIVRGRWQQDRRLLVIATASAAIALASLVPWYLIMRQDWAASSAEHDAHARLTWRSGLLILRELTGSGYAGTVLLLAGVFAGLRREQRALWSCYAFFPIALVLIGDAVMDYFLAIRQMIYVLAPLSILFVAGIESLGTRGRVLATALLAALLIGDVQWLLRPRENWQGAADLVESHAVKGACVIFVPSDARQLYAFFHPDLNKRQCSPRTVTGVVVLARNPYDPDGAIPEAQRELSAQGFTKDSEADFDGPRVELYRAP